MTELTRKSSWQRVKFGNIVKLNKERCPDPRTKGIERFVGIEHIMPENLRIRSWGLVEEGTTFTNYFRPGQVLFVKRRAYQRKVAVADFEGVCSGDIYVLETKDPDQLLPELLPFICQTESFFEHAVGTSAGSLSPRTNWTQLSKYEFALPPAAEQFRILSLLANANEVVGAHQQLHVSISNAKRSLLNELFGTTADLLPLEDWCQSLITYGIVQAGPHVENGIPYIRVSDMTANDELKIEGMLRTSPEIATKYSRSEVRTGDIIVALRGPVGLVRILPAELDRANLTQGTARVSVRKRHVRDYVYWGLQTPQVRRQLMRYSKGSTFSEISLKALRSIRLPLYSFEQQTGIVKQLNSLLMVHRESAARLYRAHEFMNRLTSQLIG